MPVSSIQKLGWVCLVLIIVAVAVSIPLRCAAVATPIAVVSALAGAGAGLSLAMLTRTRHPLAIYLWLIAAACTLAPLLLGWPRGDDTDVILWRGAPNILSSYLDLLRGGVYLIAMPFPFARFGHHAPDNAPPDNQDGVG